MSKKIVKLSDVLPSELKEGVSQPMDDYLDKTIIVHTCREIKGQNGVYLRLVASLPESEEQFYLATGASQPMEVLNYLKVNGLFPVEMTFSKAGRAIVVK